MGERRGGIRFCFGVGAVQARVNTSVARGLWKRNMMGRAGLGCSRGDRDNVVARMPPPPCALINSPIFNAFIISR